MNMQKFLEKWSVLSLKIKAPFLEMQWEPKDPDKAAAWDLYVELLTRITTQPLSKGTGDEAAALESIHKLFGLTRETIKKQGRDCIEFTKIAVVVLNQVVRPFTAKWHPLSTNNAFSEKAKRQEFRNELMELQSKLRAYTQMLAQMAGVEDLTELELEATSATGFKPKFDPDQYEKNHTETVTITACKSCNKPFSIKRRPSKPHTKDVVVYCPFCHEGRGYRKRIHATSNTDMNHVADLS